jgi:serine/threonine protein kinase
MTSVSAAADIWSVGCLCLELLTGAPPYFELQPMSALFRIVADARPPLPDSLSPDLRNFLLLCFHKVGRARHLCGRSSQICKACRMSQRINEAVQTLLPWL